MSDGGREGTGSKPCTSLREVPTRALKALPNTLLATRGDPNVMHRMSASGYSSAAHAAPVAHKSISSSFVRMRKQHSSSASSLKPVSCTACAVMTPVLVYSQANAKENANEKKHMAACHSAKQDKMRLCEALHPSRAEPGGNKAPEGTNSAQHSIAQHSTAADLGWPERPRGSDQ